MFFDYEIFIVIGGFLLLEVLVEVKEVEVGNRELVECKWGSRESVVGFL